MKPLPLSKNKPQTDIRNWIDPSDDQVEETIDIFIPLEVRRRGGTAMIIMPKSIRKSNSNGESPNDPANDFDDNDEDEKHFDERLIKTIAKAYKWKVMIEEGQASSLAAIAEKENVNSTYVSKIFDLNFLSPKIVDRILNGTQPRTLRLQDIVGQEVPYSWEEQEERWGLDIAYKP